MARAAITIRAGTVQDREFIEHLGKRTVMDSVSTLRTVTPESVIENYDRLLEIVEGQSHVSLIAELDGKRVGFLLMLDTLPDEVSGLPQAFVAYMAVERTHRGEGVGAALLAQAELEARKQGLPYISLMVTEENAPARELYERAGYVTERRLLCKIL